MKVLSLSLLVFLCNGSFGSSLPGPLVYVVTPASRPRIDTGRSAPQPFYYHNWMRRMDGPENTTTTTTTPAPKEKTPDLIFAEFQSDKMKNIRKLLEKESVKSTTSTTSTTKPIYVPDPEPQEPSNAYYGLPSEKDEVKTQEKDMSDYFAIYNNMYGNDTASPVPVFMPKTSTTTQRTTTKVTTTTAEAPPLPVQNVQSVWDIIDSQKQEQNGGQWNEVPLGSDSVNDMNKEFAQPSGDDDGQKETISSEDEVKIDDNFALPGFGTKPGIGGDNESRAIRTEPNIRFPYVNLKPFQMKNVKKPIYDAFLNSKKSNSNNNMYSLDNIVEVKHPVRGEVQDVQNMVPMRQPIERYNPAQPYLPSEYLNKNKQSYPSSNPVKAVANLVPPPPPPPPKVTDNDFPAPSSYERFPPFAPSPSDSAPPLPPPALKPPKYQPPMDAGPSDLGPGADSDDDGSPPMMDLGYRYKPPSPPSQSFLPTLPPLEKPSGGYSYDKPPMTAESPPTDSDFQGYHYDKPAPAPEKPAFAGYHYNKPESSPPKDNDHSYGHPHHHHEDYPELIYDKPGHGGGQEDVKGGDDMKNSDDSMGMAPPPMADMKPGPPDDSGFPQDFPGDFKYHHDFDDHDFHHYHHHHTTTTTTTTTEMPRVNRYSYYYLGKKLYYLPLYFSVYFIIYVGALIIKAVLRHKIVYPNSWRPNDQTASFFAKRSIDSLDSHENLHELTGRVTRAIATAAERYMANVNDKAEKSN